MRDIVIICQGVSFPGRYRHGKPKTRRFWHYIAFKGTLFPCAFRGIFTLVRVRTFVLGLFCLIVYTRRQKSVIITETCWEFS